MTWGEARAQAKYYIKIVDTQYLEDPYLRGPTNVFLDEVAQELYVARGRYLFIFNLDGIMLARLDLGKDFTPRKVVVNRQGIIFALDWSKNQIKKYDLLGKGLGELKIEPGRPWLDNKEQSLGTSKPSPKTRGSLPNNILITGLALDGADNLYLLDGRGGYCYQINKTGKIVREVGGGRLKGYIDMAVSQDGKLMAFLNFSRGKVRTYRAGNFLKEFGKLTGGPGGFSQPVAISIAPDNTIFVLDRNRSTILAFTEKGGFLGEMAGDFYFPNDLSIDSHYRLLIADTVNNRLIVMQIKLTKK
jgi:DNA-binding beta-propeller fold protein YncE